MRRAALALLAAVGCSGAAHEPATAPRLQQKRAAQPKAARLPIQLRFMQPLAGAPKVKGEPRAWQVISDRTRQRKLLAMADNEPARFAMALYAEAWRLVKKPGPPVLHIAVETGGNYARRGFTLKDAAGKVRAFVGVPDGAVVALKR